jgi:hypothetical protein
VYKKGTNPIIVKGITRIKINYTLYIENHFSNHTFLFFSAGQVVIGQQG